MQAIPRDSFSAADGRGLEFEIAAAGLLTLFVRFCKVKYGFETQKF